MSADLINLFYLIAAVLFILGLKGMTHPRTAVRGNLMGALGMLLAVVVTLLDRRIVSFQVIVAGFVVGALFGVILAFRTPMTGMPQVVAIFNGFGGGASAVAVGAALEAAVETGTLRSMGLQFSVSAGFAALIGAVTLTGSLVAFVKLQGLAWDKPVLFPGRHAVNIMLILVCIGLAGWQVAAPDSAIPYMSLMGVASLLGVLLVLPIGGADMPVVIALLNSYSGLAAAAQGWALNNSVLIVAGSLVGSAGFILTALMCKAMNRSLPNVMFAGVGAEISAAVAGADDIYAGKVKSASAEEVAMMLDGARRVVVAPGYGMAVAQAQYAVQDLVNLLESKGVEVEFAIHPMAGRMPGHMNVLLAEANVPYEKLKEMDDVNPSFRETDVVLVIGASDVVNPLARQNDPSIPIAGMPILNVDEAHSVVIIKRSLSPGFAGLHNPLFAEDNALMLFGDAKKMAMELVTALKEA